MREPTSTKSKVSHILAYPTITTQAPKETRKQEKQWPISQAKKSVMYGTCTCRSWSYSRSWNCLNSSCESRHWTGSTLILLHGSPNQGRGRLPKAITKAFISLLKIKFNQFHRERKKREKLYVMNRANSAHIVPPYTSKTRKKNTKRRGLCVSMWQRDNNQSSFSVVNI